jgi:hypothetical protein
MASFKKQILRQQHELCGLTRQTRNSEHAFHFFNN